MGVRNLADITFSNIQACIQANITQALADTAVARPDNFVTLESPRQYFIYPNPKVLQAPAVIIVIDKFNLRPEEKGANFIAAVAETVVAIIVEDRDMPHLYEKVYRYSDAMHQVLAQTEIVDSTNNVKLIVIVEDITFTPEYSNAGQDPQGLFRKEVHLKCRVEHYASF